MYLKDCLKNIKRGTFITVYFIVFLKIFFSFYQNFQKFQKVKIKLTISIMGKTLIFNSIFTAVKVIKKK